LKCLEKCLNSCHENYCSEPGLTPLVKRLKYYPGNYEMSCLFRLAKSLDFHYQLTLKPTLFYLDKHPNKFFGDPLLKIRRIHHLKKFSKIFALDTSLLNLLHLSFLHLEDLLKSKSFLLCFLKYKLRISFSTKKN
jgi:hypothetical protein